MDKNHQDQINHKPVATEDKLWLPPSYTNHTPSPASPVPKKRGMNWGFADKSFWEWLLLFGTMFAALGAIIIPILIYKLGVDFTQQQAQLSIAASERQHQTDLQIAQDQQQATVLQTYIGNIQDLLLNHNLLKFNPLDPNSPYYDVAILARARTLTALKGLDPERKNLLLTFLFEAHLIGFQDNNELTHSSIIDLSGADLSDANLLHADLEHVDLSYTNLSHANFIDADLIGADFERADLSGANLNSAGLSIANLSYTDLSHASLRDAYLPDTDFEYANLSYTDFSHAKLISTNLSHTNLSYTNLTQQQLDQVYTCIGAILPPELTCHHNQ